MTRPATRSTVEQGVRERRFGSVVTLTVTPEMPDAVRECSLTTSKLRLNMFGRWRIRWPNDLFELTDLTGPT
jgi:hypothetical protein